MTGVDKVTERMATGQSIRLPDRPASPPPGQRVSFHDLDVHAIGVEHAGTALTQYAIGWRQCGAADRRQAFQCSVKIGHPNAAAAVAQVTRAVIGRHQL